MTVVNDILYNKRKDRPINRFVSLDVETTMSSKTKFSAEPFDPANSILQIGWQVDDGPIQTSEDVAGAIGIINNLLWQEPTAIVGANVKFDINYLVLNGLDFNAISNLYDIQNMFYLKHGTLYPSLAVMADHYGFGTKLDKVSELIKSGTLMQDIPAPIVAEYLEQDVRLTGRIFRELYNPGFKLQHIMARTTLVLSSMELNGLEVDKTKLYTKHRELSKEREKITKSLETLLWRLFPRCPITGDCLAAKQAGAHTAPKVLNQLIFGHPIKYYTKMPDGHYKNGNPKFKKTEVIEELPRRLEPDDIFDPQERDNPNKNTGFKMNEEVLARLVKRKDALGKEVHRYVEHVMRARKIDKILSTYTTPIGEYLSETGGSHLHPVYNQSHTATGRLSSKNPNAQNMPPEIDAMFTCADDHLICKADFSQLEVCIAGLVSGDQQLLSDLRNGIDVHDATGKAAGFKMPMDKKTRRDIKGVNFGTIYGGKPVTISKMTGLPKATVQTIQDAFFSRYYELEQYYQEYHDKVSSSPVERNEWHASGMALPVTSVESVTGRRYWYKAQAKTKWGSDKIVGTAYSYPQTCNYPIQGMATGDIVPAYLAILYTLSRDYDAQPMAMQRTIHDSIETRWDASDKGLAGPDKEAIDNFHQQGLDILYDLWLEWTGTDLAVPLKLDVELYNHEGEEV